jgi:hypothetical protein
MASKKPVDERVRALVAAVLAERPYNDDEHIDDIERDMEEFGDQLMSEFAKQLLARRTKAAPSAPACPDCGRAGQHVGQREREILTTRGPTSLVEPECYCPACRRHFFPSVDSVGPLA